MPKIINAYAANDSIADSLKSLGESMFGNGARNEVTRQTAFGKIRENENIPVLADALASGDFTRATRAGVMSGQDPKFTAGYGQYYGVNRHGAGSEAGTRATMAVPGANYGNTVAGTREEMGNRRNIAGMRVAEDARQFDSTQLPVQDENGAVVYRPRSQSMGANVGVPGQSETLANARVLNDMTTQRQMDLAKWQDTHTLVDLSTPDGSRIIKVPKSEVPAWQSQGYRVQQSLDQVKANIVSPPQPMTGVPPAAPQPGVVDDMSSPAPRAAAPQPARPSGMSNLTQDQRHLVGLPTGRQSYIHGTTGQIGVSQDGGQTIVLPDGSSVPAMGSGFQPVTSEAALAQTRGNNMRDTVRNTPPPNLDYSNSAVSQDAYKASGLDAGATRHLNSSVGAVPGLNNLIGEIGPETQRATERLANASAAARTALLTNQFRQTNWSAQQIDKLLPQGSSFANPYTASEQVGAVLRALGMEEGHLRKVIDDPNTPNDIRQKAFDAWQQTQRAIMLFTAPVEPEAGPAAPAAQAQPAQTSPVAAPAPPVEGARQAPNGNWYVPDPNRPGKYLQVVP